MPASSWSALKAVGRMTLTTTCCNLPSKVSKSRFQSTLSSAATNMLDCDQDQAQSTYSTETLPTQSSYPNLQDLLPIDRTGLTTDTLGTTLPTPSKVLDRLSSTLLPSHPPASLPTTSSTTDTSASLTYQGRAGTNERHYFPELEPAPFPKDIHTSMPYLNRGVNSKKSVLSGAQTIHNDLESFEGLDHNTSSTIYRGTLFEYQTQEILKKHLGIYTQRSAGNGDLGVDLRGTWFLPLSASPKPGDKVRHLKVIVQCKKMNAKIGPKYVRELQGSLSYETQPTMAILAISSEFTKQALLPYAKSLWPMALAVVDAESQECRKLMWNRAAEKVMHGVQVGMQWVPGKRGKMESRPVLCFEGKVLDRLPGPFLHQVEDSLLDHEVDEDAMVECIRPDWTFDAEPEYLYMVPGPNDAESVDEIDGGDTEDALGNIHPELLTWTPSVQMQESVQL